MAGSTIYQFRVKMILEKPAGYSDKAATLPVNRDTLDALIIAEQAYNVSYSAFTLTSQFIILN